MNKEELKDAIDEALELSNGHIIDFKSLSYIILKTLELREQGLTSDSFIETTKRLI